MSDRTDRLQPNRYSDRWFKFFHAGIDDKRTSREVDFVCARAPLPQFKNVLDMCCGSGRHARALTERGYRVTAVDRDATALERAHQLASGPTYILSDIRYYEPQPRAIDLLAIMSQSFGHFDDDTNRAILQRLAVGLREGGRMLLDLWNPEFFVAHQGQRTLKTGDGDVVETKRVKGNRLFVHLTYPDSETDDFEWELFDCQQIEALAHFSGLALVSSCSGFDLTHDVDPADPRLQFLLELR